MKHLVEGKFGHGGVDTLKSTIRRKLRRTIRPKLGMASIPFDWVKGFHLRDKVQGIKIKNQGASFSCGGQAKAQWFAVVNALLTNQPYVEQSAKSVYSTIAYPGGGTTVHALEIDKGSADESQVPSYENGNPPSEWFMNDTTWRLKTTMKNLGWTPISVNIDMESIAEAIRDYGAIIWEIRGQNNGTWLSSRPLPPSKDNPNPTWLHFMCSAGAGLNNQAEIAMFQSWGEDVGDNGVQYFGKNYVESNVVDCFTFVKNPKFVFNTDLSFGMQNEDVRQLQKRLNVWQSGYFGPLTFAAVILYQKWHGLPETGFVGPMTRASLNLS